MNAINKMNKINKPYLLMPKSGVKERSNDLLSSKSNSLNSSLDGWSSSIFVQPKQRY